MKHIIEKISDTEGTILFPNGDTYRICIKDLQFPKFKNVVEYMRTWDLEYMDNQRFAYTDDDDMMDKFVVQLQNGCCGCYNELVTVGGREAIIGCNYGH